MEMEPMDFDSDGEEQIVKYSKKNASTSRFSRSDRSHLSDMDVDSISPSHGGSAPRLSMSFEHISRTLVSVLSLNNTSDVSDSEEHLNDDKPLMSLPPISSHSSTPSQTPRRHSSAEFVFNKALKPATTAVLGAVGFGKRKSGYGIPDGDINFAHFPDPSTGGSLRKRLSSNTSGSKMKQQSKYSSEMDHQNQINRHSQDELKSSVTSESKAKRGSSCLSFMLCLLLIAVVVISAYIIVILYTVHEREKCKLSRDFNKKVLELELETNVFGQHLAARIVPDKIEEYFSKLRTGSLSQQLTESSDILKCKPLVLSFDGWTGVGKNFISRFISETFQHSKIMNYIIPLNFPHKAFEDVYRLQIQNWILGNFTQCVVNIIVLDEMDKAVHGVIDGLIDAIDLLTQPCSSASPTIFLLLSNSHANDINRIVLQFLLDSPTNKREHLTQMHFNSIFTSELNVWSSTLTNKHLIDTVLPFLPLEKEHVIQCIKRDLVSKRFSTNADIVNRVLHEMSFSTFGDIHLSQTGCKRVADKVDLVMFDKQH